MEIFSVEKAMDIFKVKLDPNDEFGVEVRLIEEFEHGYVFSYTTIKRRQAEAEGDSRWNYFKPKIFVDKYIGESIMLGARDGWSAEIELHYLENLKQYNPLDANHDATHKASQDKNVP